METVFRLNADEMNSRWLASLKSLFKGKDVELTVSDTEDETTFLLKEPANRKRLLKAIENINSGKNLIHFSEPEFNVLCNELLRK